MTFTFSPFFSRKNTIALVALAALSLSACGGSHGRVEGLNVPMRVGADGFPLYVSNHETGPEQLFQRGVACGDPDDEGLTIWTTVTQDNANAVIPVFWEIATDETFQHRLGAGWRVASAAHDFVVKVQVEDAPKNFVLFYHFRALDRVSPLGRTRATHTPGTNVEMDLTN